MTAMSYCRFEITYSELLECVYDIERIQEGEFSTYKDWLESKNENERREVENLYELCRDFVNLYEDYN